MKSIITTLLIILSLSATCQTKTIHVFVALCDNINQGIVPVPENLGNGKDPNNNLYWGAMYGIKSYFKYKTDDWKIVAHPKPNSPEILDRVLIKHTERDIYILAEAYDGEKIKNCVEDFLIASNSQHSVNIKHKSLDLNFGGDADLLAYIGHDGLMDFEVDLTYTNSNKKAKDVMILACYSKKFFSPEINKAKANPIVWTTHLMAPEAYTIKSAIDGWILKESGDFIKERAAQAYNKYQKCGIKRARNLFTTGF